MTLETDYWSFIFLLVQFFIIIIIGPDLNFLS